MAYRKLTASTLKGILSDLKKAVQKRRAFHTLGIHGGFFSVRALCKKRGISHMTYYRWLRAYRAIKNKKRLTSDEKKLRIFGEAVDACYRQLGSISAMPRVQKNPKLRIKTLVEKQQSHPPTNISEMEVRTDELTSDVRCVNFTSIDSLKNM